MMMKTNIYILLLVLTTFSACVKKEIQTVEIQDDDLTYIFWDSLQHKNFVLENLDKCHFVKLETSDNCLIKSIIKIELLKDTIVLLDDNKKIFVFDNDGKFLNQIGGIGAGPDEQLTITDFYLDWKLHRVNVFDLFKSTIFSYSINGNLIERIKVKEKTFDDKVDAIVQTHDGSLILTKGYDKKRSRNNYCIIKDLKSSKSSCYIPFMYCPEYRYSSNRHQVTQCGDCTLMISHYSDTIFKYDAASKTIIPCIVFKGKHLPLTADKFQYNEDGAVVANRSKYSHGFTEGVFMTRKFLHFEVSESDIGRDGKGCGWTHIIWDMESRKGYYFDHIFEPPDYRYFDRILATTEDAFVNVVSVWDGKKEKWDSSRTQAIFDNAEEDDNPILMFHYFDLLLMH
jgi:hypothetical protein